MPLDIFSPKRGKQEDKENQDQKVLIQNIAKQIKNKMKNTFVEAQKKSKNMKEELRQIEIMNEVNKQD